MGFFGKLFEKKECSVCGGEIGLLGNRKLEDGNLCKTCARKLSPWFDDRRHSTVEQIKHQLAYRAENEKELRTFNVSRILGDFYKIYIEEVNDVPTRFFVTDERDYMEANPDIISFKDVISCVTDMVTNEFGEENTAEFEFNIVEGQQYSLEIMELPDKLVYTSGEKLDLTGMWVRIYTPDGYIDSRNGEKLEYSKKALVTLGEQKIKIAYMDAMDVFYVTVVAAPETKPTAPPTEPVTEPVTEPTAPDQVPVETTVPVITKPSEEITKPTAEDLPLASDDTLTVGAVEEEPKPDQTVLIVSIVSTAAVAVSGIGAFTVLKLKGPKGKK